MVYLYFLKFQFQIFISSLSVFCVVPTSSLKPFDVHREKLRPDRSNLDQSVYMQEKKGAGLMGMSSLS